jgi:PAS domain S-box-containing protein
VVKSCHKKDIPMVEDHYKKIVTSAPFGYIHCKIEKDQNNKFTQCTIVEANKAFEQLTQLPQEQIIGKTIRDVLPGIEKNGVDCFRVFQSPPGDNVSVEKEFQVGDRCFRLHIQFISSEYCNLLFTDLTQHKKALQELEESKEQFEVAINGTNDGIWDWDLRTNTLFLSKRWKNMLGYRDEELSNKMETFVNLTYEEDRERVNEYVQEYLQGSIEKYSIEFRMKHKDGSLRWILAKGEALRDPDGKPYRMAGSHSDITERKEIQKSIAEKKEHIESLLHAIPDLMFVLDRNGVFIDLKSGHKESLYLPREQFIGKPMGEVMPKGLAETIIQGIHNVLEGKKVEPIQYQLPIGTNILDYEARLTAADSQHVIAMVRDVTVLKQTEAALIESREKAIQASKAKSEFLANMSHEIRTPLNGVIGFTDLLLNTPLNLAQKQYAENANTSGKVLLGIINDILDFSKIEAGKLELDLIETDLVQLVEETVDIIKYHASQKNLELLMNLPLSMPRYAVLDPVRLKQVLMNLLSNAVKFTEQGEIEVRVQFSESKPTTGEYIFSVRDTGIGISEEQKKKLFQSFSQGDSSTTRKYGGTGLGLVISNLLVEKMGGTIHLKSSPGKGSVFSFTLQFPISKKDQEKPPLTIDVKRVLVVDDNDQNRLILKDTLAYWGIEYVGCDNGLECLRILANSEPFDVIIMDYHMPYMDGLETIRKIKEDSLITSRQSPIIMLHSSSDNHNLREESKKLEVDYFLVKPVKSSDLLQYLHNIHQKKPLENDKSEPLSRNESGSFKEAKKFLIVIAEDVDMNMMLAKALLMDVLPNTTILEAKDGLEAVKLVQTHPVDLVFMDVQMPVLDGLDATRRIRKEEQHHHAKHIPIVALTAGALTEEKQRCLQAGMDDFLPKPIHIETLHSILRKHLFTTPTTEEEESSIEKWMPETQKHFDKEELLSRIGNNTKMFQYSLAISNNIPQRLSLLKEAIAQENPEKMKQAAHSLKGAASMISFNELARLGSIIEANFDKKPTLLQKIFHKIEKEWELLQTIIEKEKEQ